MNAILMTLALVMCGGCEVRETIVYDAQPVAEAEVEKVDFAAIDALRYGNDGRGVPTVQHGSGEVVYSYDE